MAFIMYGTSKWQKHVNLQDEPNYKDSVKAAISKIEVDSDQC